MKNINAFASMLIIILLLGGCMATDIMRTWNTPEEYDKAFNKLMVIGLAAM